MPEKDFTEIKFDTQIGRMMAFTMTKIRNHVIKKVNERAYTLQKFKDDGLNEMMSIDILQEIQKYKYILYYAKLFKRRECNNCWEAQPNRPLLHSRRLNNDHYIKTFSVIRCNNHHYCKKFCPEIAIFRNFLQ